MSVLSATAQKQVEDGLVKEGALTVAKLAELKGQASNQHVPFLSFLVNEKQVSDEVLTKAIAGATKVPYVNLATAGINPEVLDLLPEDIAERYMAVPLGEMQI